MVVRLFTIAINSIIIFSILQMPLSEAYWWQTLGLEKQNGRVILTCFEKKQVASGFTAYSMCLDGVNNAPTLKLECKQRAFPSPSDDSNEDFVNYKKAWTTLEKYQIGDTLSAEWVEQWEGKIILTALDNQGSLKPKRFWLLKMFDGLWYFSVVIALVFLIGFVTAPRD